MNAREIELAVEQLDPHLSRYAEGDEIAILAGALCRRLERLSTPGERYNALLLVLTAFGEIGVRRDERGNLVVG